uniref:ATP synthase 8 n=1 Tax=Proasellus ibericus TaxID=1281981 RepID=A0A485M7A0_9CRUS|nr:ATP synthase 8 [Proasellus ibericus]
MPQMAPMFWTLLMTLFTLLYLSFLVKLYFHPTARLFSKTKKINPGLKNFWTW